MKRKEGRLDNGKNKLTLTNLLHYNVTLYRLTGLTRGFRCFSPGVATQESDGGCDGSDAEMIGNGRRGGGTERDRDMEEDEDEGREERSSEGGGGGGFGGWRSHLLGGLTQRVKSWYWGARPLVSLNLNEPPTHKSLPRTDTSFFLFRSSLCLSIFLLIFLFPFFLFYFTFKASLVLLYFKISIFFFFLCSPMSFAKRFESRQTFRVATYDRGILDEFSWNLNGLTVLIWSRVS